MDAEPASRAPEIVISPMSVAQVLDAGFNLARQHYPRLVRVGLWGLAPAAIFIALALAVFTGFNGRTSPGPGFIFLAVVGVIAYIFGLYFAFGSIALSCGRIIEPALGNLQMRHAGLVKRI